MTVTPLLKALLPGLLLLSSAAVEVQAASCGSGSFDAWLNEFKTEASAKGISQNAITTGLSGVTPDQAVLSRDRSQKVFQQSFEEFSGRMIPPRLLRGSDKMKQYGSVLGRIEQTYGVPGSVLVAIWAWKPTSRQHRKIPDHPLPGDPGLRLPACRDLPRRTDGCLAHHRARRPHPGGDARRLGWRDRPDPVHAIVLRQIRGGFRQ